MVTMRPRRCSAICFATGLVTLKKLLRFVAMTCGPLLGFHEDEQRIEADAGVVDEHINPLVRLDGRRAMACSQAVASATSKGQNSPLPPARWMKRQRFFRVRLPAAVVDQDMTAACRQRRRHGPANSPARARDQSNSFVHFP